MDRAHVDATADQLAELFDVVGDAAADAAHRERRTDDRREADLFNRRQRIVQRAAVDAVRHVGADLAHRVAEQQPVLGEFDRVH